MFKNDTTRGFINPKLVWLKLTCCWDKMVRFLFLAVRHPLIWQPPSILSHKPVENKKLQLF